MPSLAMQLSRKLQLAVIMPILLNLFVSIGYNSAADKSLSRNCTNSTCITPSRSRSTSAQTLKVRGNSLTRIYIPPKPTHKKSSEGIKVAKWDFARVQTPFVVCMWILLASIAKIVFHQFNRVSSLIPESCMLILLGVPIGILFRLAGIKQQTFYFNPDLFFLFLLPPIILDAGYFMPVRLFYLNIGTILLYATVGTIFNAIAIGSLLYGTIGAMSIKYTLMHALLFGSLISAVDPVAVLAVFEEVHVHEVLYILVFGESVLNDAASVVLYHTFEAMANMSSISIKEVALACTSFFVVSVGGTLIGVIWGIATSFVTRFTEHVRVIEPIFIFVMSYAAYLSAEIFHFSGIMAILFCGIIMKPYVESNVSRKSHTTIKYFLKLLSTCCETIIFMFLGVSLVINDHRWDFSFIILTLVFILVVRTIGVVCLTSIANSLGRLQKIGKTEQFIMSYGGLRGAVAFCLAILLDKKHIDPKLREMLVTTTMVVVLFTVFVQGTTIKPLVRFLKIRRKEQREMRMTCVINDRILDHLNAGMEEVLGHHGHGYWREQIDYLNKRYFRRWLERDPDQALDEEIIVANRKIAYKNALRMAENPSAFLQKFDEWSAVKRNPSYAVALALRENSDLTENQPHLDTGVLTVRNFEEPEEGLPHNISFVIPRARAPKLSIRARTLSTRKYTLAALDEPDEEIPDRHNKIKRNALSHMASSNLRQRNPGEVCSGQRKHKRHHRRQHHGVAHRSKQSACSSKQDNPLVTIESWDAMPEGEDLHNQDGNDGIVFKTTKPVDPIEMKELDSCPNDVPSSVLPIPDGSEPVKDDHFSATLPDKEIIEDESLRQCEHSEETEFLVGKLQFRGDIP